MAQLWAVSSSRVEDGVVIVATHGIYRRRWWARHQANARRRLSSPDVVVYVRRWPTPGIIDTRTPLTNADVERLVSEWRAR